MPDYQLTITVIGRDQVSGVFRNIGRALNHVGSITAGILLSRVIVGVAHQFTILASSALNAAAQFQMMQVGLEGLVAREMSMMTDYAKTIAEVFPDARIRAKELMDELARIAILSPYTVEATQQVFKMQMAFGFTTDQAKKMTAGLLNMAAGIGASQEMLQRMAYNLAQINLQGKVTKLDIRQLALAGLDLVAVLRFVGKEMGLNIETHKQFNDAIASGQITWEQFATSFQKYAEVNFGGAAERMARTLVGLKSTWHDVWVLTMPKMLLPPLEQITLALGRVLDMFIRLRESGHLEAIGEAWGKSVKEWLVPFNTIFDRFELFWNLQDKLKEALSMDEVDPEWVDTLKHQIIDLGGTLRGVFMQAVEDSLGKRAVMKIEMVIKAFDKLRAAWDVFKRVVAFIAPYVIKMFGWLWDRMKGILEGLTILWGYLGQFWLKWGWMIKSSIDQILYSLGWLGAEATGGGLPTFANAMDKLGRWIVKNGANIAFYINLFAHEFVMFVVKVNEFVKFMKTNAPGAFDAFKTKLGEVVNFFQEDLPAAWDLVKQIIYDDLIPAFKTDIPTGINTLVEVIDTQLLSGKLGEGLKDLGDKFTPIGDFFKDHGPAIAAVATGFAALAGSIGGATLAFGLMFKLLPAAAGFFAMLKFFYDVGKWLFTVLPAISAVKVAFAALGGVFSGPLLAALVVIGAAIGGFVAAFTTNFGGLRDYLFDLWEELQPLFAAIGKVFSESWTAAVEIFSTVWNSTIKPAFTWLSNILREYVFPTMLQMAQKIIPILTKAVEGVTPVIQWLVKAFKEVWGFLSQYVFPIITTLAEIALRSLVMMLQLAWSMIKAYVLPFLKSLWDELRKIWDIIVKNVQPVFDSINTFFKKTFGVTIKEFIDLTFKGFVDMWNGLKETLKSVLDWLKDILQKLKNAKIPDWAKRDSPSPIEMTFIGVRDALEEIGKSSLPRFAGQMNQVKSPYYNSVVSQPITVQINVDRIDSDVDINKMAYTLAAKIKAGVYG